MNMFRFAVVAGAAFVLTLGASRRAVAVLPLPKSRPLTTLQTTCWDSSGAKVSCSDTGQDADTQFGKSRQYTDKLNGTIKDNRTGLIWEKLSNDGGIHDKDALYTWDQAFARIRTLNTSPCFANRCDWRMPNLFELQTLANLSAIGQAVPVEFKGECLLGCHIDDVNVMNQCSCAPIDSNMWSSTTYIGNPLYSWSVVFADGGSVPALKTDAHYTRAVTGGQ